MNVAYVLNGSDRITAAARFNYALVMDGERFCGAITKRDLIGSIAQAIDLNVHNVASVLDVDGISAITLRSSDFRNIFTILNIFNHQLAQQQSIEQLPIINATGDPIGVVTIDSLLQILQTSALFRWRSVAEFMSTEIIFVDRAMSVLQVTQLLVAQNSSYAVIGSTDSHLAIVTELDILRLQVSQADLQTLSIGDAGSSGLIYINQEDSLLNAYQAMQRLQVDHLGSIDLDGNLVGMITLSNLIEVFDSVAIYNSIEQIYQGRGLLGESLESGRLNPVLPDHQPRTQSRTDLDYWLAIISLRLRQSLNLEEILETAVLEIRQWLQTDRVFIYPFNPDWDGSVNFESVSNQHWSILGRNIRNDHCEEIRLNPDNSLNASVLEDIYTDQLDPSYIQFLAQLQVRASLVVPIPKGVTSWGLLIVHQCSVSRIWQPTEIEFLEQFAVQLAINIHQSSLLERSQIELSERKQAQERLLHHAFHDALTDLPNRALFMERLGHAIERTKRNPLQFFSILFLDLDRFKVVNDSLGHTIGDRLLIAFVQRLQTILRSYETFARLGGDEFVILLEDVEDINSATTLAERIQLELSQPFIISGYEVFTSVSIGIVFSHPRYEQPESILRDADTAMYQAKSRGKSQYVVFDTVMYEDAVSRMRLENELRRAIERQELVLYYQPIMSLVNRKITGFEALVRWQHPQRGLIPPLEFIPIAEETGLIIPIGEWVLYEACSQLQQWQEQFPSDPPLNVSVNISSIQINHQTIVEQIETALHSTGLAATSLKLEITESAILDNIDAARSKLEILRSMGIQIYIDDFGTGYSSFQYLQNLPIDVLKIDNSFIRKMLTDSNSLQIVQTIITLANNIGMAVVAEGVETVEQLSCLESISRESVQGYYISRPLDIEATTALISRGLEL